MIPASKFRSEGNSARLRRDESQLLHLELVGRKRLPLTETAERSTPPPGRGLSRAVMTICSLVAFAVAAGALFSMATLGAGDRNIEKAVVSPAHISARLSPEAVVRKFLEAADADTKASLTRFPARDLPLIRAFYADRACVENVREIRDAGLLANEERSYFSFAVALADGVRVVAVTGRDDGMLAVDWKCFAAHEVTPWESFLASGEHSSEADFRIIASRSDYRNFEFGEPGEWAAYRLLRPGRETPVYGYARIGSPAHAAMESALGSAERQRIMIRIRATGQSSVSGQVEILSCLQSDWLERASEED